MLIKLSSVNEADPTKFRNTFSDALYIPPNSWICLIKGQVNRIVQGKKLVIDASTPMNIRFNPYDIRTIILNPGVTTTYTLDEFCAYVLTLLPNGTAFGQGCQFVNITENLSDNDIELRFWSDAAALTTFNYGTFMFGNPEYQRLYLDNVAGKSMPKTGPDNLGAGVNQTQIGGDTGNYCTAVAWDLNKYTLPTNQVNSQVHNMYTGFGELGIGTNGNRWIIAQPNLKSFKISLGKATHGGTSYTTGPIVGTPQFSNPGDSWGNLLLNINYKTNGKMDIQYFNALTNNVEEVVTDEPYNPGNIYYMYLYNDGMERGPGGEIRRYYSFAIEANYANGLSYWIPGKTTLTGGNTAMTLNDVSGVCYNLTLEQFYLTHVDQTLEACNAKFISAGMDDTWLGTGYRFSAGCGTDESGDPEAKSAETATGGGSLISNGVNEVVKGLVGSSKAWTNDSFFLERYTAAAVAGPTSDKNAICRLDTNGIPLTTPFYIGFYFRPENDVAKIGAGFNNMCVLGSTGNGKTLAVSIAQAEVWDMELSTAGGGVPITLTLTDPGATRISITLGTNYFISLAYMGTGVGTGKGTVIFRMYDMDADILYDNTADLTTNDIDPLFALGGSEPTAGSNYDFYSCAHYSDFRLYQKNQSDLLSLTTWDDIQTELQEYWKTGVVTSTQWYWGGRDANILPTNAMGDPAGGVQQKYKVAGLPRPEESITQFFQRDTLVPPTDSGWYDVQNVYALGATILPNALRNTTLPASAYAGPQTGLASVGEIEDELTFTNPAPDLNDDVLKSRKQNGDSLLNPQVSLPADLNDRLLDYETINIDMINLPMRGYNGVNRTTDNTIYQMPLASDHKEIDNQEIHEVMVPQKVWLPLNNPGPIPLNSLDVQLSDVFGKKLDNTRFKQPTNIVVQIEKKENIV